jgi:hypothetical protein
LLPTEPEEVLIQSVLANLQNIIELEVEALITKTSEQEHPRPRILQRMENGFVSVKSKTEWILARGLMSEDGFKITEEIRKLRDAFVHVRPAERRNRFKYFDRALLTQVSIRRLFVDAECILHDLREKTGRENTWQTVPPDYAEELGWPSELVERLGNRKKINR